MAGCSSGNDISKIKGATVMKSVLTFLTFLGLATATVAFAAPQNTPNPAGDQKTTQKRDRTRTPGSERSGAPKQDQDKMQKRDRIHTPGSGQVSRSPGTGQRPGTGTPRGGSGRRGR